MEEEKEREPHASSKELVQNLRRKRLRKYALTALVLVIAVSTIVGLSIENKDAKIADGQGNVIIGTGEDVYEKAQEEKDTIKKAWKKAESIRALSTKSNDSDTKKDVSEEALVTAKPVAKKKEEPEQLSLFNLGA